MKKILYPALATISCFAFTVFIACKKNIAYDTQYGIEPATQIDMVNKSLRLDGKLMEGAMPVSAGGSGGGSLSITSYPEAVEVGAGVLLYIPYSTNNNSNVCKLYLQISGADSYWEVPVVADTASSQLYITVFIPNFVQKGNFDINFSVADCNGSVSGLASTYTEVTEPLSCGGSASGSVGITVKVLDLGNKAGVASIDYDTYSIPDKIDLKYDNKWIRSTGPLLVGNQFPNCDNYPSGFVGEVGTLSFNYDPSVSRFLYVYITGCDGGTAWDITVNCPR